MTTTIVPTARRALLGSMLVLLSPAMLAACGDDDDDDDAADDGAVEAVEAVEPLPTDADGGSGSAAIDIVSVPDGFGPSTITVDVGTEVVWTNTDGASHTSTADGGAWDSGSLGQDESFSFTPSEAGTFAYFCAIHPSMTGELIVE